jgi:hypothetical protein
MVMATNGTLMTEETVQKMKASGFNESASASMAPVQKPMMPFER